MLDNPAVEAEARRTAEPKPTAGAPPWADLAAWMQRHEKPINAALAALAEIPDPTDVTTDVRGCLDDLQLALGTLSRELDEQGYPV